MRKPLLAIWLAMPLAAWAYHEGPGQERLKLDEVDAAIARADEAAADQDWSAAVTDYEAALEALPSESVAASRRIRVALNQAKMQAKQLVEARSDLAKLVEEMAADDKADAAVLAEARSSYASAQYYYTWLMRLEGATREEWEPEIEAARQTYRLLAEQAEARSDTDAATTHKQDLEAAVLLARMDLQELQGLPLPSQ